MKYLIELKDVDKVYKTAEAVSFQALKNINLKIKRGEFISIVGPSGSGKSTLMNIIGLLDKPTKGRYIFDGEDVSKLNEDRLAEIRNKKIGFVFQNFNLLQRTTSLDNVALPLIYKGVARGQREKEAEEALSKVKLSDKVNSFPNQLSGGEQQRVAIARAIVTSPETILADEPTGNLDTKTGQKIIEIFERLNSEGKTIILITHSPEIAKKADRTIKIKDGEI